MKISALNVSELEIRFLCFYQALVNLKLDVDLTHSASGSTLKKSKDDPRIERVKPFIMAADQ